MAAVIEAARLRGITVHRVSQGSGIALLTDAEIHEMASLGMMHGIEVCLFVGPRAPWEGTAGALAPDGRILGWRHTGMDQLAYAYSDVARAVDLGIRSVLVADEGLVWLIAAARDRGQLPASLAIKASALLGLANPIGIRMLAALGLGSVNISSDTTLARLGALRQVIDTPVDLYVESPDSLGGFTRYHELPDLVRVGAPIYLKFGLRNSPSLYPSGLHLDATAIATSQERVRRASIGIELLGREAIDLVGSSAGAPGLALPIPSPC
jgi:hypothetical protein